jgi:hypothetical protein
MTVGLRSVRLAAGAAILAAPALVLGSSADARRHRVHPPAPVLYRSFGVSEREWSVRPSHNRFRSGLLSIRAYNYGMDDHDLAIVAETGETVLKTGTIVAAAGGKPATVDLTVTLAPGRYRLICTYFADGPDSHEAKGMLAWIRVY